MKHIFSLGANFDVCERCGSDHNGRDSNLSRMVLLAFTGECPGWSIGEPAHGKVVRAAMERGFQEAISAVSARIEAERHSWLADDGGERARSLLWNLLRNPPSGPVP